MRMDSLSQALQARRGKSLDPSMMAQDVHPEAQAVQDGSPADGGPPGTPVVSPPEPEGKIDQQLLVAGEDQNQPAHISPEDDEQMRQAIGGNVSQQGYEQMRGMKPRSLAERAQMDVLKKQYSKDAK